jgi:alkylation response protein AidB-like acyl-CoA dehydrogenase
MRTALPDALDAFLLTHAESLDAGPDRADAVVPELAASGAFRRGLAAEHGGDGQPLATAIATIAAVAERSLAAAFVCWSQRTFVEYLVRGENPALRERWLPALLDGRVAGATGLSNAMKFMSGIESLNIVATPADGTEAATGALSLSGRVPWVTNVPAAGFLVAVAVSSADGGPPFVATLRHDHDGIARSADLDLIALRGSNTASLRVDGTRIGDGDLIARDARHWLPRVRPAFLALQCGMPLGLARASLAAARERGVNAKAVLGDEIDATSRALEAAADALAAGVADGRFVAQPAALFELRIRIAELAVQAARLELSASGGLAYHRDVPLGFARRWREAAFVPIVTPSLVQLQGELQRHRARTLAAA